VLADHHETQNRGGGNAGEKGTNIPTDANVVAEVGHDEVPK
jgi:hypothetical protein